MKRKRLLVVFLVGIILLTSVVGYGEINRSAIEARVPYIEFRLLRGQVGYMMMNPNIFLYFETTYDATGRLQKQLALPENVDTMNKF